MVNQGAIYRQLRERFGDERARRISTFAGATTSVFSDSLMNHFERHDVLAGLAAVFGSMLFDAKESIDRNTDGALQTGGHFNDLTVLSEIDEIVALTNAADPQPDRAPSQSLAELLGLVHRDGDPINEEAEKLAGEVGASFSEEGRA